MKRVNYLLEGAKLLALFGAIALVVSSMPERTIEQAGSMVGQGHLSSR